MPGRSAESVSVKAQASQSSGGAANDRELVITRVIDAPRDLVFKAWTEAERMVHWLGPRGFTASDIEHDVRPGGAWRARLRPDAGGKDLWQGGVYREVVKPERLVFTFAWDDENGRPGLETLVTITFAEQQGKTRMTFRQSGFKTVDSRDGYEKGWNSTFDRLDDYVATV